MKKIVVILVVAIYAILVGGCANDLSPDVYTGNQVGVVSKVFKGVVLSKRIVKIDNNSNVGGVAGAVAGAAAGSAIGGNSAMNVIGAVGGAVAGGMLGNQADKAINKRTGYEYIIKLTDGNVISVTQEISVNLGLGQQVLVIYGPTTRVVPDNT